MISLRSRWFLVTVVATLVVPIWLIARPQLAPIVPAAAKEGPGSASTSLYLLEQSSARTLKALDPETLADMSGSAGITLGKWSIGNPAPRLLISADGSTLA